MMMNHEVTIGGVENPSVEVSQSSTTDVRSRSSSSGTSSSGHTLTSEEEKNDENEEKEKEKKDEGKAPSLSSDLDEGVNLSPEDLVESTKIELIADNCKTPFFCDENMTITKKKLFATSNESSSNSLTEKFQSLSMSNKESNCNPENAEADISHDKESSNSHSALPSRNQAPRFAKEQNLSKKETRKEKKTKERKEKKDAKKVPRNVRSDDMHCSYCNVTFYNRLDFQNHCRSDRHQHTIMSDEGRKWKFRPPPRGVGSESYTLCSNITNDGFCRFGIQCVEAHSPDELREWKERFEFRQKKAQKAAKMYGKTFADMILEKVSAAKNKETILKTHLDNINCECDRDLAVKVTSKSSDVTWTFEISTKKLILHNLALLNDVNRHHFSLLSVLHVGESFDPSGLPKKVSKSYDLEVGNEKRNIQEWSHPDPILFTHCTNMKYVVTVGFRSDIFGTFRQSVVFSFGFEPHLIKDMCVEVVPHLDTEDSKLDELKETLVKQAERWDPSNSEIIDFDPPILSLPSEDEKLLETYPFPKPSQFRVSQSVLDPNLTRINYKRRLHDLLYIEEMSQFEQVSQFNVVTKILLTSRYLLMSTSSSSSTAKYARPGELFGKMKLGSSLSEDTPAGRIILTNCSALLLTRPSKIKTDKRVAYAAAIEDTGKSTLYLRLSSSLVSSWKLGEDQEVEVEVQFQLNRLPICEMHYAIDRLSCVDLVYPDTDVKVVIPWTPGKQWSDSLNAKLNAKQREAVVAITTPLNVHLPPILIIGPYGTGKTFTLGQAIKMILTQEPASRVLVCTHSNSAADLYIREYLHPYIEKSNPDLKLLRIYYKHRWVQTVHASVQKYCLISMKENSRVFRYPSEEDITNCQIVVATLSTSRVLSSLNLPENFFTHILLDEAAQAMETEAILPLALASSKTRIVLAGDHMQLSPEVFSQYATEKKLNKSLLERLYDLYPQNYPCKILLCENYRSHEAIINYTSELFYEQKLVASGKQKEHESWHPLTLFTARGEDIQDVNSTSFYNNSEVYEVVERVSELQKTWPKTWGHRDENSIGIVTPYYDQVQRIRSELRRRKLYGVSVERVLNVQGKQFRAIFLSTVRTRKTCLNPNEDDVDFGFLSNAKLLNTAITRAQSLVAVVGDPVSLCSIGKCRKLWERFVDVAHAHHSLFGITFSSLRAMLDGVELKKSYVLNPLAPEFVPRAKRLRDSFLAQVMNAMIMSEAARLNFCAAPPHFTGTFPRHLPPGVFTGPPPRPPPAVNPYITVPPFPVQWMKLPPPVGSMPDLHGGLNFAIPPPPPVTKPPISWNSLRPPAKLDVIPGLIARPGSPPRVSFPGPLGLISSAPSPVSAPLSPRLPNVQFANTKYQRIPITSGINPPPGVQSLLRPILPERLTPAPHPPPPPSAMPMTAVKPPIPIDVKMNPEEPASFTFLKNGVHFPQMQHQPVLFPAKTPAIADLPLELLPKEFELMIFLQSPQMQLAWFNHLSVTCGPKEAHRFKEMMIYLHQNPELLKIIKEYQVANKLHSTQDHHGFAEPSAHIPQSRLLQPTAILPNAVRADEVNGHSQVLGPTLTSSIPQESKSSNLFCDSLFDDGNSLNDVLKNDPILSEILQQNDEPTPGRSTWGPSGSNLDPQLPVRSEAQSSGYVPLYLRKAGAPGGRMEPPEHHFRPVTPPEDHSCFGRFTQLPVSLKPESPPHQIPMFSRSDSFPERRFSNTFEHVERSEGVESCVSKPTLTYANVLRNSQPSRDSNDPLMRIRNLGIQGNRVNDQQTPGGDPPRVFSYFGNDKW